MLPDIADLKISRWLDTHISQESCELHVFCDGSMEAYSAAVYLKTLNKIGAHVHLLMAKTKVTPKQRLTVPRIELCAACLAVKLHKYVRTVLVTRFENCSSFFWTDSRIVLNWIKGDPDRWKTYVCNRIHLILGSSSISQWHHVASADNPADVSSRGTTPVILNKHKLWWHGPHWLRHSRENWPISNTSTGPDPEAARPVTSTQQMGNLPSARVRPSRPFAKTGVDYAGPIDIRMSKGRGSKSYKGYIAVFVCLCTKAIHLETVSDLTTSAFLAALQRFFARRGAPADMYSDCGSTFIGANRELHQNTQQLQQLFSREILPQLAVQEVTWHFIPPYSPHFGGLWEAGVKSMKHHLKRILPNATLTFEEISTVLCRIEACLNSRPLCPISDSKDDFTALTPGHFLIGDSLLAAPEKTAENLKLTNRWHQLQKINRDFWKIWSQEYLSRLQIRPKWNQENHTIEIGDLVLIKHDNLPQCWKLRRIIHTHKGADNLIRVVTLKTQDGITKHPIVKICILPSSQKYNELQPI